MTAQQRSLTKSFIDVRSLVFWVGAGLTAYGLLHLVPLLTRAALPHPAATALAAFLWLVYGLLFAVIVYRLELFERRSSVTMFGAFIWGAVVASGIAVVAAPAAHELVGNLLPESMQDWTAAFSAPIVEEPLKMLGVVALAFIPGARINSAIDGLFFGLIVGLGFEVTESFLYTIGAANDQGGSITVVVMMFVLRGIVGGLWNHPTFTAITGAGVGYFFGSTASLARRTAALVGSLLVAMVLHGFFDSPLVEGGNVFVTSIVKGLPALVVLVIVYRIAQSRERDRFASTADLQIDHELIAPDELESLTSRKGRRHARHATRKAHGWSAGHAHKRLQRRQSELVGAMQDEGPHAQRTLDLAAEVREARSVLEEVSG